jgi:alkylation response protein AidB-like acyl-CoA dehydrogenase
VVDCLLEQWAARAVSESEELSGIVLDQAQRLFAGVAAVERLAEADRGQWPEATWEAVEQAGLPLALVPEPQGGVGLAAGDGLALIRLAGYHALPVPLPETMMAAALWARVSVPWADDHGRRRPHRAQRRRLCAAGSSPARPMGRTGAAHAAARARPSR